MSDQLPTLDPPKHTDHRSLLLRLITPKRLKSNEEFMWRLADRQLDTFLAGGECEFIGEYASPFAMLVIADLLGVPEEDHERFEEALLRGTANHGAVGSIGEAPWPCTPGIPVPAVHRLRGGPPSIPGTDVLTGLATATFPDGSTPDVIDVVRVAANLFAAGQETTVRLLSSALQLIAEDPELQRVLRDPSAT